MDIIHAQICLSQYNKWKQEQKAVRHEDRPDMFTNADSGEQRAKSNLERLKTIYDLRDSHLNSNPKAKKTLSSNSSSSFDINNSFITSESSMVNLTSPANRKGATSALDGKISILKEILDHNTGKWKRSKKKKN